jgi:hypothetical protein
LEDLGVDGRTILKLFSRNAIGAYGLWRLENTVISLRVPLNVGNSLNSSETVSVSKRDLLH